MSPRALIRGGVLAFASVDAADQGEYSCRALNTHGEHTARVALMVHSRFHRRRGRRRLPGGVSLKTSVLCQSPAPVAPGPSLKSRSAPKTSRSTRGTR